MAREFGRIRLSINDDDDFEELTPAAQWLYCRLAIPEQSLNHCGVFDWRPARLLGKARGLTRKYLEEAARELEAGRFVLFDLETDEALLRSYVRSEELLRNPKMAVAVLDSYRAVASKQLRAQIVDEVRRIKSEHPEYSSWASKFSEVGDRLEDLLTRPGSDRKPYAPAYQNGNGISNGDPVENGIAEVIANSLSAEPDSQPDQEPDEQRDSLHLAPSTLHLSGGNSSPVAHQSAEPDPIPPPNPDPPKDEPPSRFCSRHPEGTSDPCDGCEQARKRRAEFDVAAKRRARAELQSQRDSAAAAAAQAVVDCGLCNDDGYRGTTVCDHREHSTPEVRANALAAARAALAKGGDE
jgi:hypothetical protein